MFKIDESLFYKVQSLKDDYIKCVVWVNNWENSYKMLKNIFNDDCIIKKFPFINAFGLKVTNKDLLKLNEFPWIEYVTSVQKASILMDASCGILGVDKLHKNQIFGQGVTVAVIDTGCYNHLDFVIGKNRIIFFKDFVNNKNFPYDDNGHGTFVTGVIAGNGLASNGKFCGIAPACDLIILKALDKYGETQAFTILDAMQWIYDNNKKYNIKVVCMSFGSVPLNRQDPLIQGAEILWDNGICVVSASGNDGPESNSIKSPGASPKIITVGSADKIITNNNIKVAPFSSRGPAFSYVKPDLIAPGVDITSTTNKKTFYTQMSGTSVSTPMVAGVCALLLGEYQFLKPNRIKTILLNSSKHLQCDKNECGFGLLDAYNSFLNV